eukprot:jgi/Botrbrau1/18564/Bobra.0367s0011.1
MSVLHACHRSQGPAKPHRPSTWAEVANHLHCDSKMRNYCKFSSAEGLEDRSTLYTYRITFMTQGTVQDIRERNPLGLSI